jgi:hypothetical protein
MSHVLHICENYNGPRRDDVRRALGLRGTLRVAVFPKGEPSFDHAVNGPGCAVDTLAAMRAEGQRPVIWLYGSAGNIASGAVPLRSDLTRAHARATGHALCDHLAAGGLYGALSIDAEPGDDWKVTPAAYIESYEESSEIVRDVHRERGLDDCWVRVWAPTALKNLTNAIAYRPPSAKVMGIHTYGLKTFKTGSIPNGRLNALTALAHALGLPLCVPEAGVVDLADIATTGRRVWDEYYKRLLAWAFENKALFVTLLSQKWNFGAWLDGTWAAQLSVVDGQAAYPGSPAGMWGLPGCDEACGLMAKKLAGPQVAKLPDNPFALGA